MKCKFKRTFFFLPYMKHVALSFRRELTVAFRSLRPQQFNRSSDSNEDDIESFLLESIKGKKIDSDVSGSKLVEKSNKISSLIESCSVELKTLRDLHRRHTRQRDSEDTSLLDVSIQNATASLNKQLYGVRDVIEETDVDEHISSADILFRFRYCFNYRLMGIAGKFRDAQCLYLKYLRQRRFPDKITVNFDTDSDENPSEFTSGNFSMMLNYEEFRELIDILRETNNLYAELTKKLHSAISISNRIDFDYYKPFHSEPIMKLVEEDACQSDFKTQRSSRRWVYIGATSVIAIVLIIVIVTILVLKI